MSNNFGIPLTIQQYVLDELKASQLQYYNIKITNYNIGY